MATIAVGTTRSNSAGAAWGARFGAAALLISAFWFVGQSLTESVVIAEEVALGPDRAENRVAVQQAETTTSSAVGYFLVGGAGLIALAAARWNQLRLRPGLLLLCGVFVAWSWFTILWSVDPMQSFRKLAIFMLLLTAAFGVASRLDLDDLLWVLIIALTFIIGVGVLAEAAYGTLRPWRSDYRFCGTVHPNDQGVQCALLALAAALAQPAGGKRRWWLNALFALALGGLWFTKSRTTLAAFLAAAAVALILRARGMQRWLVLSGCLTLLCLGGIAYSFVSVAAVGETADVAAMGRTKDVNSLTGRLPLWEELLKAANRRPWLGYGHGGFWHSLNTFEYSEKFSWHIPHGHNAYLDLVLNVGVVGLGLYLLWFLASAFAAVGNFEREGKNGDLFAVCLCVFAAVHGITESKFPGAGLGGFILYVVLAMTAVRRRAPQVRLAPATAAPPTKRWRDSPAWSRVPRPAGRRGTAPT
jgi:exopolysaccharide production protein ExoQ